MVFAVAGNEALDDAIKVRLSSAEKAELQAEARIADISMSELVRRRYFGRPIVANADLVMIRQITKLGALLKHVHNESDGVYSSDTMLAIRALRTLADKLAAKIDAA